MNPLDPISYLFLPAVDRAGRRRSAPAVSRFARLKREVLGWCESPKYASWPCIPVGIQLEKTVKLAQLLRQLGFFLT